MSCKISHALKHKRLRETTAKLKLDEKQRFYKVQYKQQEFPLAQFESTSNEIV